MNLEGPDSRRARRRARLLRAMLRTLLAGGIALLCMATLRAPAAVPAVRTKAAVPSSFHGVWQPDSREGRKACRDYRMARPHSDELGWALIDAVIVHADVVHEVADMGEGNFISVDRVSSERDGVLRIDGRIGLDMAADETSDPTTLRLRRTGDVLEFRETFEGRTTRNTYRYCAPTPRD